MTQPDAYDRIGVTYAKLRKPDPRIGAYIHAALGDARSVPMNLPTAMSPRWNHLQK
jgi:hypothetical protein